MKSSPSIACTLFVLLLIRAEYTRAHECSDKSRNCPFLKRRGFCKAKGAILKRLMKICPKTCGFPCRNQGPTTSPVITLTTKMVITRKESKMLISTKVMKPSLTQPTTSVPLVSLAGHTTPARTNRPNQLFTSNKIGPTKELQGNSVPTSRRNKLPSAIETTEKSRGEQTAPLTPKSRARPTAMENIATTESNAKDDCKDSRKYPKLHCHYWTSVGFCNANSKWHPFMMDHCRGTCGMCNQ